MTDTTETTAAENATPTENAAAEATTTAANATPATDNAGCARS